MTRVSISFDQNTAMYGDLRLEFREYRRGGPSGLYLLEPGCTSFCGACAVRYHCGANALSCVCMKRNDGKNGYWKEVPQ